jgi:hypothetical protein
MRIYMFAKTCQTGTGKIKMCFVPNKTVLNAISNYSFVKLITHQQMHYLLNLEGLNFTL